MHKGPLKTERDFRNRLQELHTEHREVFHSNLRRTTKKRRLAALKRKELSFVIQLSQAFPELYAQLVRTNLMVSRFR